MRKKRVIVCLEMKKSYAGRKNHRIKQEVTVNEEKRIMANKFYRQGVKWYGKYFSG